ncbi:hypothetical protein [Aliiglaciecola sp. LCG003]|uniref:hypothetical protein n=1 Tax=Aliiglaciecola sp. LCG003 TaxID=3053655 RepID=UPI0025731993|nr:hypothetical protein [Aliiglaciecola sp. LCG003]WJG08910.1 hypothetical protein QR722_16465 [Aliiglaciecola sp. LCG003]
MRNYLLIWLTVFSCVLIPATMFHLIYVYFYHHCDPKFGCFATLELLTLVNVIYALLASISALFAFKMADYSKQVNFQKSLFLGLIFFSGLTALISSAFGLKLAETFGIPTAVIVWLALTFLISLWILKVVKKQNMTGA